MYGVVGYMRVLSREGEVPSGHCGPGAGAPGLGWAAEELERFATQVVPGHSMHRTARWAAIRGHRLAGAGTLEMAKLCGDGHGNRVAAEIRTQHGEPAEEGRQRGCERIGVVTHNKL